MLTAWDEDPTRTRWPRSVATSLMLVVFVSALSADEIKRRDDAPKPKSPEESGTHFQLPDDLDIELVAAEPLLSDPSCITWDEHGRLFVSEIHGYNLEGHLDVEKLNKTGELDTVVRRIYASDESKAAAEEMTYGSIRLLTDTDDDGRMDESTVFATDLPPCFGLVPARGGIIAVGRPEIIYLADRDGDGKADVRETLFTGFKITILERSINNPRWGLDNWIYVAAGREGGNITGPHLTEPVTLGATDFRFRPDGSAIEAVTGRNSMYGQTMNDWGDRFVSPPAVYAIPIPQRYLLRNPYLPAPTVNASATGDGVLYPTSQPHPWRVERSQKKEWNKYYSDRYGSREASPNGFFTSACGQMVYRADLLPVRFHGNVFSCDPAQNLVHRRVMTRNGLRFRADRAPEELQSEFLSSTDQWFRPINLLTGPDGGMYIVDMYREIIEDYSAIPRYLQQQYGLMEGNSHGRIWKMTARRHNQRTATVPVDGKLAAQVALLSHPNAWQRQTAQRFLVESGDAAAVPLLQETVRNGATPQARLHALYTLSGMQQLTAKDVLPRINDEHYGVRVHALRLAEPWLNRPSVLETAMKRVEDPDARVRLQLALSLGESTNNAIVKPLVQLMSADGEDPWMRAAVLSSVARTPSQLMTAVINARSPENSRQQMDTLLEPLAAMIGTRRTESEITQLLHTINGPLRNQPSVQTRCLTGLQEGLQRGQTKQRLLTALPDSLRQLIASDSKGIRSAALKIAAALGLSNSPEMAVIFSKAVQTARDDKAAHDARIAALDIVANGPADTLILTAGELLNSRNPTRLQLAAVSALEAGNPPGTGSLLIMHWVGATPAVRQTVLNLLLARTKYLAELIDALESGRVSPNQLSALQWSQLTEQSEESLRNRAKRLFAANAGTMEPATIQRYRTALQSSTDATRGKTIFEKTCAVCHTINGRTAGVGPDLAVIQTRTDETVLLDILQPSSKISSGFDSYVIVDTNGRTWSGILSSESATSLTLKSVSASLGPDTPSKVRVQTILRQDIDEIQASSQSLMPDRLHEQLTPQNIADVIDYIRSTLDHSRQYRVALFDDDPNFPQQLTQGGGTIQATYSEPYAGNVALRVSPPQRYSATIAGWDFPIRETPQPGEYRYLRLAWRTDGGHGALIELADNGRWPDSKSPQRRYYSGTNSTDWAATKVSADAPDSWTVITCDLWKDCGDFTLTGIAPTAMGGDALFDQIELLQSVDDEYAE